MSQDHSRLLDVSASGARLRAFWALEVGSVHDFAFDLLGETIRVRARVKHCLPEDRGSAYQVGVQFVNVEPAAAQRLADFARRRRGHSSREAPVQARELSREP